MSYNLPNEKWYTDPQSAEDKRKFIAFATQFIEQNAQRTKKDFIDFVKYYNSNKDALELDAEESEALSKLHAMWKKNIEKASFDFFIKMKDHHLVLNGKLMGYRPNIPPCQVWLTYITNFQAWRGRAMYQSYTVLKLADIIE